MRRICLVALLLIACAGPASSQGTEEDRVSVSVLGGASLPLLDAREAMGTGWNVGAAGTLWVGPSLGIRADYLYSRYGAEDKVVPVTLGPMLPAFINAAVRAKSQMHFVSLDLAWRWAASRNAEVTLVAGPTLFRRRVQLTAPMVQGIIERCEAQWLQCDAEVIPFDRWLGIRKSDDLGFNAGAAFTFRAGLTAAVTIEARYFYVNGPTFHAADGRSASASAHFVPISIGLSF